jgi:DNA polymerase bacteriophage-type
VRAICIDYETHFSDEYSLSRMSTENYVRDPRFKAHGAAIRWSATTEPVWYDESRLRYVLSQEDWSDTLIFAWHCNFDGLILTHHYGVKPKMWGCPMSMARLLHPIHQSVVLDAIRKLYGMPAKITPYSIFKGKQWDELNKREQEMIGEGACDEVNSIWTLFKKFVSQVPIEELDVIDSLVSMFVNPVLRADTEILADLWESEALAKQERMKALGITEADVQSAAKFQALLEAEGVEIEYKQGKNGDIPQFAKNDDFMQELLEHDDDRIRTLAEARIGAKSTLLQTRAETLGNMANRGPLCVYLRYCGAATLRPTGGDGANWLNFKRGSAIRRSILAPEGYLLGPVDASQIECRVLNYLAGQDDVIEKFRRGEDPYVATASACYGETIYKPKKGDPREEEMTAKRGMGKQSELLCGYGAGPLTFQRTAKSGTYGPRVDLTLEQSDRFVTIFRDSHPAVCAPNTGYWAQCGRIISRLAGGPPMEWGPFLVKDHKLILPSGQAMLYDTLEFHRPGPDEDCRDFERNGYWRMKVKRGWKKMWGSKLTQNICEMVSRVIVSQAMIRIKRQYGIRSLNWPYDELLLLIPDNSKAEETLELCRLEMCREPSWLPGIPLDAEASLGKRYSK